MLSSGLLVAAEGRKLTLLRVYFITRLDTETQHMCSPYPVAAGAVFAHASKHAQQQACLDKLMTIDGWTQRSHQLPQLVTLICLCRAQTRGAGGQILVMKSQWAWVWCNWAIAVLHHYARLEACQLAPVNALS